MNPNQDRTPIVFICSSYWIIALLVIISLKKWLFESFLIFFMLAFVLLVIRDITPYLWNFKKLEHRIFTWTQFFSDSFSWAISRRDAFFILNRVLIFPIFLISYIILILFKQLDILSLSTILKEYTWIEYMSLWTAVFLAIMTVFREGIDAQYYKNIQSKIRTRSYFISSIILSLSSVAIIFHETSSLGFLSIPISIMTWLLVYLIAVLILEETDQIS